MADCVVIVSGGMDSVTLLHYLQKSEQRQPAVITFLYGQKHVREVECAKAHAAELRLDTHLIVDLQPLAAVFSSSALVSAAIPIPDMAQVHGDPQPPTYVPNRNMIFIALAAAYAENLNVREVYYGAQRHDEYGYWDTTSQFLDKLNRVYQLNRKAPIQIRAPFIARSKAEILRTGMALGVDYGQTWSCYAGQTRACGRCPTCVERLKAFAEIDMTDPIPYA